MSISDITNDLKKLPQSKSWKVQDLDFQYLLSVPWNKAFNGASQDESVLNLNLNERSSQLISRINVWAYENIQGYIKTYPTCEGIEIMSTHKSDLALIKMRWF